MGTFVVGAAVFCLVGLAIRNVARDKKQGRFRCGGDCSRCHGGCH